MISADRLSVGKCVSTGTAWSSIGHVGVEALAIRPAVGAGIDRMAMFQTNCRTAKPGVRRPRWFLQTGLLALPLQALIGLALPRWRVLVRGSMGQTVMARAAINGSDCTDADWQDAALEHGEMP